MDQTKVENQLRLLGSFSVHEINPDFHEVGAIDIIDFWIAVWNVRNAEGKRMFEDLAAFALRVLSLPISNAVVERVFSYMNIVKSKVRNRMGVPLLAAILRIRIHFLSVLGVCCYKFTPTSKMFELFNSSIYDTQKTSHSEIEKNCESFSEIITLFAGETETCDFLTKV